MRIDPATRVVTVVSGAGPGTSAGGVTYDPADQRIYAHSNGTPRVFSYDAVTYAGPTINAAPTVSPNYGMTYNGTSLVLAPGAATGGTFYSYDPATGACTALFPSSLLGSLSLDDFVYVSLPQDDDYYSIRVTAGDLLTLATTTPGDGPGEFVNTLDPKIELYDPTGALVASDDNGAPDGRNALLSYTALASGTYDVRVTAAANLGEYVLSVAGATGGLSPFVVTGTNPADGSAMRNPPATITVDFNDGVLLTSLQASDLTVDGVAATGLSIVDGDTVTFNLPTVTGDGTHTVAVAAGAILDVQGTPIQAYTGHFTLDQTPPRVVASSIQEGDTLVAGGLTYVVQFSEPMLTANLDATDFSLQGTYLGVAYNPSSFSYDPTGTTLTIHYASLPEDRYTLTLLSADGRFEDAVGNNLDGEPLAWPIPPNQSGNGVEGGNFFVDFWMDAPDPRAFPTPLTAVAPNGSLIYDPSAGAVIGPVGDTDSFTISLDAGQTITALVDPGPGLQPTVTVRDPSGAIIATASAGAAGADAVAQTAAVSTAGAYTLTVGSLASTTGKYTVQVFLNAALEAESYDGAANNSASTAQNIDNSFISLGTGVSRGAVLGTADAAAGLLPAEVEPNNSISQANSAVANFAAYSGNLYDLGIKGTISSSTDADWFKLGSMDVGDVITLSESGSASSRGTLPDSYMYLYRYNNGSPILVASDDDSGPGLDSLIYRYSVTTADVYYAVADAYGSNTGTYDLGVWLENSGAPPATGGTLTSETEPNDSYSTANDASTSWRAVQYLSQTSGTITSGDLDYYAFQFTAGDLVTLNIASTSSFAPQGVAAQQQRHSHCSGGRQQQRAGPQLAHLCLPHSDDRDVLRRGWRLLRHRQLQCQRLPLHLDATAGSHCRRGLLFREPCRRRRGDPWIDGLGCRDNSPEPGECRGDDPGCRCHRRHEPDGSNQQLLRRFDRRCTMPT